MRIIFVLCLSFAALLWQLPAEAAIQLELTQGMDKATPIAVVPFGTANDSASTSSAATTNKTQDPQANSVSDVVEADLQNSGFFKLMTAEDMSRFPHDFHGLNYDYWRSKGVDDVIVGNVTPKGNDKLTVTMALVNIYTGSTMLNENFTIPKTESRALAHHISDLIYQQLTGQRGIFSTRLAYVLVKRSKGEPAQYALQVADEDGHDPQSLLTSKQPIMSPAWSPDGKSIAYVSFETLLPQIFVQNLATGKRKAVSEAPGINGAPAWSPSGQQLALVLTKTGHPNIFILNLKSHKLEQVTRNWSIDTEPSWALDGKSLIFTSNRGGSPQIYQVNLKNKKIKRVTYNGKYNARASFSPDGKSIVMLHLDDQGKFNIALQDLKSGALRDLTQSGQNESPSMAPNGSMVLFATRNNGRGVLGMASVDTGVKLRLPAQEGSVQEPAWSPYLS